MILHNKGEPLGPYSWEKVKEEKWTDPVSNLFHSESLLDK